MAPGRCVISFRSVIFKVIILVKFMSTSEITLGWFLHNTFDNKSTLVQVMNWQHRAITWANANLDQCNDRASSGQKYLKIQHLKYRLKGRRAEEQLIRTQKNDRHYKNSLWKILQDIIIFYVLLCLDIILITIIIGVLIYINESISKVCHNSVLSNIS